ncbi:MAG: hypothetical protein SFY67_15245 [Candidatus Melainabacteria bacterium]|nr:hypothetical protein [Candidatus Melainabacteria bacterium]
MKKDFVEQNKQFILTCFGLATAAILVFWLYDNSSKQTRVHNLSEAIARAKECAKSNFETNADNPCLAHPAGVININGHTMDQWEVWFPKDNFDANCYLVYSNGRSFKSQTFVDMFPTAQKFDPVSEDVYKNWPKPISEKLELIKKSERQNNH